jgi:hypothetical protein
MKEEHTLGSLLITAQAGWLDVTDEIGAKNAPFTLTKNDGFGALQFTAATFKDGVKPKIIPGDLQKLLADFASSRELRKGYDPKEYTQRGGFTAARSFTTDSQFVRVWYCSNGQDIALVTYVCQKEYEKKELRECEKMIADLAWTDG